MSHTPGPWRASPPDDVDIYWEIDDCYGHAATVYGDGETGRSNASLVAAAPDMLAILEDARSTLEALDAGEYLVGWRNMDATEVDQLIASLLVRVRYGIHKATLGCEEDEE